jgi:hypothetical protein
MFYFHKSVRNPAEPALLPWVSAIEETGFALNAIINTVGENFLSDGIAQNWFRNGSKLVFFSRQRI